MIIALISMAIFRAGGIDTIPLAAPLDSAPICDVRGCDRPALPVDDPCARPCASEEDFGLMQIHERGNR